MKGVSGGERKRTSIAFELISDPAVIILDEPTSGLDSLTSFIIVQDLRNLAKEQRKTVVMTIHQPNSDIFELFDRLTLMVEGRIIYQGNPREAVDYFGREFGLYCLEFFNPSDYFMSKMHYESVENRDRYPLYFSKYEKLIAPRVEKEIEGRCLGKIERRVVELGLYVTYK